MKEFEEDNLENFFRNRAEGDQYDFREEDWAKMAAKLDAKAAMGGFSLNKYFWMVLGAAISSLLFLIYINFNEVEPQTPVVTERNQYENQVKKVPKPTNVDETLGTQDNLVSDNLTNENTKLLNNGDDKANQPIEQQVSVAQPKNDLVIRLASTKNNTNESAIGGAGKHETGQSSSSDNQLDIPVTMITNEKNIAAKSSDAYGREQVYLIAGDSLLSASAQKASYVFSDLYFTYPAIKKWPVPQEIKSKRFYTIGISGAMDISSTGASRWGKPVFRLGLSGEYFINNRLSIGLGVNLSEKKYTAHGREYQPPKGFWTNGVVPDSTNAVCKVLDVPVTISYYQPLGKNKSIVFHAGMSSWFMLREDYWYKYASNDPDLVKWWGGENENRYWFGIVNMAISYEYMINNTWSIMAGPYLNLPLTGVGHGNVALRSFGFRTSLRLNKYKLSKMKY